MKRFLLACLGLGFLPLAPGTWGSLPPAIAFGLMYQFALPPLTIAIVMLAFIFIGSALCVLLSPSVIASTGKSDPGEVVADELAGQAVTFLPITFIMLTEISTAQIWTAAALGFIFFRIFDIFKPWPIRSLEKLSKGWGILADDLFAGVYAGIALTICYHLWIAA